MSFIIVGFAHTLSLGGFYGFDFFYFFFASQKKSKKNENRSLRVIFFKILSLPAEAQEFVKENDLMGER